MLVAERKRKNTAVCKVAHEDKHPTRESWQKRKARGKTRAVPYLVSDPEEDDVAEQYS